MPAPIGAIVSITYDAPTGTAPRDGDYLRTQAGRLYRVLVARSMTSKYPNRYRLELLVIDEIPSNADPSAMIYPLVFYKRS